MTHPAMALIVDYYLMIHGHIVRYAEGLSEAQLSWQATPDSLSIAFYLWHIARWADNLQFFIPGMTEELSQRLPPSPQIWKTRGLAKQWGFSSEAIGYDETGMEMDEAQAARLNFPSKDVLLEYLRATFTVIEAEVKALTESDFVALQQCQPGIEDIWKPGGIVGGAILEHLTHDLRHLGMIECLVGLQSGQGSATG